MSNSTITHTDKESHPPIAIPKNCETQSFNTERRNAIGIGSEIAAGSIDNLNQLLADTMTIRDLYKKHHWQVSGRNFYSLHLLFDKHFQEQSALIDQLGERVQTLGGVSIAMAIDVVEISLIPRAPKGREDAHDQISRLLQAHEIILIEARAMAREADKRGDPGTNDLIVSNLIRTNELQAWFLNEHVQ